MSYETTEHPFGSADYRPSADSHRREYNRMNEYETGAPQDGRSLGKDVAADSKEIPRILSLVQNSCSTMDKLLSVLEDMLAPVIASSPIQASNGNGPSPPPPSATKMGSELYVVNDNLNKFNIRISLLLKEMQL